jgi:hypothetical protein
MSYINPPFKNKWKAKEVQWKKAVHKIGSEEEILRKS